MAGRYHLLNKGFVMPSISHFQIYKPAEPCGLTGEELKQTMEKIVLERLSSNGREFDLKGYCVGSNGMSIFSKDERLSNLKRLNLGGNRIGDEGAKLLAESPIFSKLQWLELGGSDLGPEGIRAICRSTTLKKLKTLNVYRNLIKNEGARFLAKENCLSQLEELDLAQNEIGDEGLMALAISKLFPNLVAFYIDNNFASAEAKEDAKNCPNFHKLESLNL